MSMNRAYLLFSQWGFAPSYFVCINGLVLEQFHEDIVQLPMPKFLNFTHRKLFDISHCDGTLIFLKLALAINDGFSADITKQIYSGGTVTYASLQLAYYMGFKEVVLIGLDHSFVEKGKANKIVVRTEDKDESHCHPNYFPKGIKWGLPDLYRSEIAYSLAKETFEADGRRIIDATVDGQCNVFPKGKFDELVKNHF